MFFYSYLKKFEEGATSWFSATYSLLLESRGLKFWEVFLPNVVFHLTLGVIDPFTGFLGDKFGHIRIYLIGAFVYASGNVVYWLGKDAVAFNIAEFIIAIGASFMSDALESWLTNKLGANLVKKLNVGLGLLLWVSIIPAVIGAGLGQIDKGAPFLATALTMLFSGGMGIYFVRKFRISETVQTSETPGEILRTMVLQIRCGIVDAAKIPEFRVTLLTNLLAYGLYKGVDQMWSIVLAKQLRGNAWPLGFVWVLVELAMWYGTKRSKNHTNLTTRRFGKILLFVALPIGIAALSQNFWITASFFVLHEIGRIELRRLLQLYVNQKIGNKLRATLNSTISSGRWLGGAGYMFFCYLLGSIGIITDPQQYWIISSIGLFFLALWLYTRKV